MCNIDLCIGNDPPAAPTLFENFLRIPHHEDLPRQREQRSPNELPLKLCDKSTHEVSTLFVTIIILVIIIVIIIIIIVINVIIIVIIIYDNEHTRCQTFFVTSATTIITAWDVSSIIIINFSLPTSTHPVH